LAAAVDGAKFPEIAGTIAGDDTVLIITPNKRQRASLQQKIESLVSRPLRSRAS
jgi:transcriptional regulator of arginine metabolism